MSEAALTATQLLYTFEMFDKNKDGCISADELRSACQKLQMSVDERRIREIFQQRESIKFDEFCRIMQDFGQHAHDAYFHETFRAFDRNDDGFITAKEIKKTMKDLGETLTDKQAKDMLKAADANRDGKLSREEFRTLFNYITQQATTPPLSPSVSTSTNGRMINPFENETNK